MYCTMGNILPNPLLSQYGDQDPHQTICALTSQGSPTQTGPRSVQLYLQQCHRLTDTPNYGIIVTGRCIVHVASVAK